MQTAEELWKTKRGDKAERQTIYVAAKPQFNNYHIVSSGQSLPNGAPGLVGTPGRYGLFLKMHGSFNWVSMWEFKVLSEFRNRA